MDSSPPRCLGTSELPDLTQQLIESGMHEQYIEWSNGYRKWREGKAHGAKGELSADQPEAIKHFKYWYPDQVVFRFRQTLSYWIPILTLEGSLLFAFASLFGAYGRQRWPQYAVVLTERPCFVGGLLYIVANYMIFFEVINIGCEKGSPKKYIFFDWRELQVKYDVKLSSLGGALTYLVGALIYQIPCTAVFFADKISIPWRPFLFAWPSILGGICFVLGGICECVHNDVLSSKPDRLAWWGSVLNLLGDICFLVAVSPRLSVHNVDMVIFVGCIFFVGGSAISLTMWKSNQFGRTLLAQLNAATGDRGVKVAVRCTDGAFLLPEDDRRRSFSPRGVLFLLVYTFTAAMMTVNCFFYAGHPGTNIRSFCIAAQQCFNLVVIHMILILHSAGLQRTPNEQPFKCLLIAVRFIGLAIMLHSLLIFWVFLGEAEYLPEHFQTLRARRPLALSLHRLEESHAIRAIMLVSLCLFAVGIRTRRLRLQRCSPIYDSKVALRTLDSTSKRMVGS